jgi:hypothetical protein
MEQIASKLLHFIFGVVELILTRVGGGVTVEQVVAILLLDGLCCSLYFFLRGEERVVSILP